MAEQSGRDHRKVALLTIDRAATNITFACSGWSPQKLKTGTFSCLDTCHA